MSKHTPGPWYDDGYRIYAPTNSEDPSDGRMIVEYKHVDNFNRADAPLIAAAPTILRALRALLEAQSRRVTAGEWKQLVRDGVAAAAKATA